MSKNNNKGKGGMKMSIENVCENETDVIVTFSFPVVMSREDFEDEASLKARALEAIGSFKRSGVFRFADKADIAQPHAKRETANANTDIAEAIKNASKVSGNKFGEAEEEEAE